jgi:hypothetical protein
MLAVALSSLMKNSLEHCFKQDYLQQFLTNIWAAQPIKIPDAIP